jgi:hypothetical protein
MFGTNGRSRSQAKTSPRENRDRGDSTNALEHYAGNSPFQGNSQPIIMCPYSYKSLLESNMSRNQFDTRVTYAARLNNIFRRPIENSIDCGLALLRLEFEVFQQLEGRTLRSFRQYACREFVIGNLVGASKDANILAYAQSLSLSGQAIDRPSQWEQLKETRPWIKIKFGPVSKVDYRQPFEDIARFDSTGWKIEEYGCAPNEDRVSVEEAAKFLYQSLSTIRRKVDRLALTYGEELLTYTDGGHRRINLEYLRLLLDE